MNTPNDASDAQINALIEAEAQIKTLRWANERLKDVFAAARASLTHDTPDTAPTWDGTPDAPKWSDQYTLAEIVADIDYRGAMAAKAGRYDDAHLMAAASECIQQLDEQAQEKDDALAAAAKEIRQLRTALDCLRADVENRQTVRVGRTQEEPGEVVPVPYSDPDEE